MLTLSPLTPQLLADLARGQAGPCLSLYLPTHRHHPDNQQDLIRYRNLVKELESRLREMHPAADPHALLAPFEALGQEHECWQHALDGLAVLGAPNLFHVIRLQAPVTALASVADTFHLKPLSRILQAGSRYQVLGLSLRQIQLFEGNQHVLDEIALASGVPRTLTEALGTELTEAHSTVSSYGGIGAGHSPMHHGHGGKKDEVQHDMERFCRLVDAAILQHHSQPSGLPLLLAALPEHHHLFHKVSHNPFLLGESLPCNPDTLPLAEIRERAWQVIEPASRQRGAAVAEEFAIAKAKDHGSDELAAVAKAAVGGRVAKLLIESDRPMAGRLNCTTGACMVATAAHPQSADLLDDLAEVVTKLGGQVIVLPAALMPGKTGLAALYRY